jgi:hypothetical protein
VRLDQLIRHHQLKEGPHDVTAGQAMRNNGANVLANGQLQLVLAQTALALALQGYRCLECTNHWHHVHAQRNHLIRAEVPFLAKSKGSQNSRNDCRSNFSG